MGCFGVTTKSPEEFAEYLLTAGFINRASTDLYVLPYHTILQPDRAVDKILFIIDLYDLIKNVDQISSLPSNQVVIIFGSTLRLKEFRGIHILDCVKYNDYQATGYLQSGTLSIDEFPDRSCRIARNTKKYLFSLLVEYNGGSFNSRLFTALRCLPAREQQRILRGINKGIQAKSLANFVQAVESIPEGTLVSKWKKQTLDKLYGEAGDCLSLFFESGKRSVLERVFSKTEIRTLTQINGKRRADKK